MSKVLRIMGIDPGYAIMGYGILDLAGDQFQVVDYGCIRTQAETAFPLRLLTIDQSLDKIFDRFAPDVVAIEELFFYSNTTTAIGTAQARGVAVVAAARREMPVYEYTPMQVKLAVTGYGKADKAQVQEMVRQLLRLKAVPRPDDVADALAIAICHGHEGNRKEFLAVAGYQYGPHGYSERKGKI